jgi:hypothetical protein
VEVEGIAVLSTPTELTVAQLAAYGMTPTKHAKHHDVIAVSMVIIIVTSIIQNRLKR